MAAVVSPTHASIGLETIAELYSQMCRGELPSVGADSESPWGIKIGVDERTAAAAERAGEEGYGPKVAFSHFRGGLYDVVMKRCGKDLTNFVNNGALSQRERIEIVAILAGLLKKCHADTAHGDIKLDNVLYDETSKLGWLIDFPGVGFDNTGNYLPPERAAAICKEKDLSQAGIKKADVYAAGIVLLALLTGRILPSAEDGKEATLENLIVFRRNDTHVFRWVKGALEHAGVEEAKRLMPILKKVLCHDPSERYTASQFDTALREYLSTDDVGHCCSVM